MTLAERLRDPVPYEEAEPVPIRIQLFVLQALVERVQKRVSQLFKLDRMTVFAAAMSKAELGIAIAQAKIGHNGTAEEGNLSPEQIELSKQRSALITSSAQFNSFVYPLGVTPENARRVAPTFLLSVDQDKPLAERELIVKQVNPVTLEPLENLE